MKIITSFCVHIYSFLAASRGNVIGVVSNLRAGRCGFRISAKVRGFSILQNVKTVSEAHSATYLMGNNIETSETNAPETRSHNLKERIPHVHRCKSLYNWRNFDACLRISSRLNARKGQGDFSSPYILQFLSLRSTQAEIQLSKCPSCSGGKRAAA